MANLIDCSEHNTSFYIIKNYSNKDAVYNVIRYITRTRVNEDRKDELIDFAGFMVPNYDPEFNDVPSLMISSFEFVQDRFRLKDFGGSRIVHLALSLSDEEYLTLGQNRIQMICELARQCASTYCNDGFQVVYAVHYDNLKHAHIHFAINSINISTGLKFNTSRGLRNQREQTFNIFLYNMMNAIRPTLTSQEINQINTLKVAKQAAFTKKYYGYYSYNAFGVFDNWNILDAEKSNIAYSRYKKFTNLNEAVEFAIEGFNDLQFENGRDNLFWGDPNSISINTMYYRNKL